MRQLLFLGAVLALAGCAQQPVPLGEPGAPRPTSGVFAFQTAGSLVRSADGSMLVLGPPLTLSGELRLPEGSGPFPAVILAHGCGGQPVYTELAWGRTLREWGYATFVVDSFSARGVINVCSNALPLLPTQRVPDAYGALRLLAANPKIDPKRIALMGFSHGGALTMVASTAWAKETFAPPGQPAFRAFFPFYPFCNPIFPERDHVSAPVRIHTGAADDWTPAAPCAELAASLKASGQDVAINVYPNAYHAFDQAASYEYMPSAGNGAGCFPKMASVLGPMRRLDDPVPKCVTRGATIGPNAQARADAERNLHAQLDELLK
ncbi:MAG: dienelactone hydrolase family protein [Betaproteobacteria bacterium]|nr:dienelactone hydrolase family protein [Betaproteobacteria bacterium]